MENRGGLWLVRRWRGEDSTMGCGSTASYGASTLVVLGNNAWPPDTTRPSVAEANIRVAKNTIVLVALRVLMPALAVALVLTLSRYLGAPSLGRYTLAFGFLCLFNAVAPLGLAAVIIRDGTRDRAVLERLLGNAMPLGAISSVILSGLMAGLASLLDYDSATRVAIFILSLAILPCTIGVFQDSALVALERMDYIAFATIAEYVLKVGGGILLLLIGYGLEAVLIMALLGRIVACVISAQLLQRLQVSVRWTIERETVLELLRLAPTFLFIGIFATLYWRIDIFMLSKMHAMEEVGIYGAAWRVLELAMVIPQSLCLSLYPRISAAAKNDLQQLTWIGNGAIRYLLTLCLPTAIGITALARPILSFLYGHAFDSAALTLIVLILTLVPYGIVRYHAYVLVGANHQRIDLLLNIVMSVVNIVLNLILIPLYSHLGAAIATLVSICAYGVLQYAYLMRKLPGHAARLSVSPVVLVACAIMALCTWALRDINTFATIVAAVFIYGGSLLAGGFFSETEIKLLKMERLRRMLRRL